VIKASNTGARDSFGSCVALSGDGSILAVGADAEPSAATGTDGDQADDSVPSAGAVYIYD
jgi:FG-GAP repeat